MSSYDTNDLQWVGNSKKYYFSAADMQAPGQPGKDARKNFEISTPTDQCNKANEYAGSQHIGEHAITRLSTRDPKTPCYICGLPINYDDGTHTDGRECEHILTASSIAMLIGLPSDTYSKVLDNIIDDLIKDDSVNASIYTELKTGYESYQKLLWPYVYAWSHPRCNKIKDNWPFLKINYKSSGPVIFDPSETSVNIRKVLCELHRDDKDTPETTLQWQDKIWKSGNNLTLYGATPDDYTKEKHIDTCSSNIGERIKNLHSLLTQYPLSYLKSYCSLSTRCMLDVVINKTKKKYPGIKFIDKLGKLYKTGLGKIKDKMKKLKNKLTIRIHGGGFYQYGGSHWDTVMKHLKDGLDKFIESANESRSEPIIYTPKNLPNDVIFGVINLMILSRGDTLGDTVEPLDDEEERINEGDEAWFRTIFNETMKPLTDIDIDTINTNEEFDGFCIAFREYVNYINAYDKSTPPYNIFTYILNQYSNEYATVEPETPQLKKSLHGTPDIAAEDPSEFEDMFYMKIIDDWIASKDYEGYEDYEDEGTGTGNPYDRGAPLQEDGPERDKRLQREEGENRPVGKTFTKEQLAELDRRLEERNKSGSLSNVSFTSKYMGGSYNKKKKRSYKRSKRRVKRTHRKKH